MNLRKKKKINNIRYNYRLLLLYNRLVIFDFKLDVIDNIKNIFNDSVNFFIL